jgi:hypothetical protein
MHRTLAVIFVALGISGTSLLSPAPAGAASDKCANISAQCALEVGGVCDPATGRWRYGRPGVGGTNKGGAFDACIARKLKERR